MGDLLTWSINLGRVRGTQVRVHYFLLFFALGRLFNAAFPGGPSVAVTAGWLAILMIVLILHELGHAAMAMVQKVERDDVLLWPLGNFVVPSNSYAGRSGDSVAVAVAGIATSGLLAIGSAIVLAVSGARMVFSPFGEGVDPAAPYLLGGSDPAHLERAKAFQAIWFLGWFGYLNWVVFLANLIPALPFDNGRVLRTFLARSSIGITRDNPYPQWTARGIAVILAIVGLLKVLQSQFWDGMTLFALAFLIELVVRSESKMMEDSGFFEDGVFGYDFSEGYTSLESSAAKVRPYRESAIKRWRRRRSELRKQRRLAKEAAEDQRMDEILEKLHAQGRAALTEEENRFLVRVSTKLRNRPRARD